MGVTHTPSNLIEYIKRTGASIRSATLYVPTHTRRHISSTAWRVLPIALNPCAGSWNFTEIYCPTFASGVSVRVRETEKTKQKSFLFRRFAPWYSALVAFIETVGKLKQKGKKEKNLVTCWCTEIGASWFVDSEIEFQVCEGYSSRWMPIYFISYTPSDDPAVLPQLLDYFWNSSGFITFILP